MEVYAVKHIDDLEREKSQSGGAFVIFSDLILEKSGVVYGCVIDNNFNIVHERATSIEQRDLMRKSKYCASNMGDVFRYVKNDLDNGRYVLFSGTTCQVAGLRKYLGKNYERLLTVDIVCHGVPSPLVLKKYIRWREVKHNSKLKSFIFRDKTFGWSSHVETLMFENGVKRNSKIYTNIFYGHNALRPVCYHCPYKSIYHDSDLTIADYWGIENTFPEFRDEKGVSLLLVNNSKGKEFFEKCKDKILYKASDIKKAMQPPLVGPFEEPITRKQFWEDFSNLDFVHIAEKYGGYTLTFRVKQFIKRLLKKRWLD